MKTFYKILFIALSCIITNVYAQGLSTTVRFSQQDSLPGEKLSALFTLKGDSTGIVWQEKISESESAFRIAFSTDDGSSWSNEQLIETINTDDIDHIFYITALQTEQNRLLFASRIDSVIRILYSDDNGSNWSLAREIDVSMWGTNSRFLSFYQKDTNEIWISYEDADDTLLSISGTRIIKSMDEGETWSSNVSLLYDSEYPFNQLILSEPLYFVKRDSLRALGRKAGGAQFYLLYYSDSTDEWEQEKEVFSLAIDNHDPTMSLASGDTILTFFQKTNSFNVTDIYYQYSYDLGNTFNSVEELTRYEGIDNFNSVVYTKSGPLYSFITDRNIEYEIWLGSPESDDSYTPPCYTLI